MLRRVFLIWVALLATSFAGAAQADSRKELKGTLVAIETATDPDTLLIRTNRNQQVRVALTATTVFELDGNRIGSLADLEVGDRVEVQHRNYVATRVEIKSDDDDDDGDDRVTEVKGVITAINTATDPDQVTIRLSNGTLVTVGVTANTEIKVDGDDDAAVTDLAVGDLVEVKFNQDTLEAFKISVEDDGGEDEEVEVRGVLVDVIGNVAFIDTNGDGQADLQLEISDRAEFKLGNLKLDRDELNLLIGLPVKVEYRAGAAPGTGVLVELKAETQQAVTVEGVVLSVDAAQRLLTIRTAANQTITLTVPEDVRVYRSGRPVTLSAVAVNDQVRVQALLDAEGDAGVALRVDLVAPVLRKINGRIIAVNGSTITVLAGRQQSTFVVDGSTRFTLNNRTSTLAALGAALSQGRKIQAQVTYREQTGDDLAVEVKANANR